MAPRLVASPCTAGSQACEQEAGQQRARRTARLPGSWCFSKPLYVKKGLSHTWAVPYTAPAGSRRLSVALCLKAQGPAIPRERHCALSTFQNTAYLCKAVSCLMSDCNLSLVSFATFQNLRALEILMCSVPYIRNQISKGPRLKGRHGCGTSFNREK